MQCEGDRQKALDKAWSADKEAVLMQADWSTIHSADQPLGEVDRCCISIESHHGVRHYTKACLHILPLEQRWTRTCLSYFSYLLFKILPAVWKCAS